MTEETPAVVSNAEAPVEECPESTVSKKPDESEKTSPSAESDKSTSVSGKSEESTSAKEDSKKESTSAKEDSQKESTSAKEYSLKESTSAKEDSLKESTSAKEDSLKESTSAKEDSLKESTSAKEDSLKESEGSAKESDEKESSDASLLSEEDGARTNDKESLKKSDVDKSREKKAAISPVYPKFEIFVAPDREDPSSLAALSSSSSSSKSKKRRASGSYSNFVGNDPYRPAEMSPETTLIEFIVSSAAYHGVKQADIKQLEWDILRVFANNVMPANAAAWYMAKRRYYLDNSWEYQLLPFLLKKYPDKFFVQGQTVEFLEVCTKDVAKRKMQFMVNQGLFNYFSHKVEEYGVYFFDPSYYEHTEPFHANLRIGANLHVGSRSKLVSTYFAQYNKIYSFKKHNPYLVSLSKVDTPILINTTGIIISMIDKTYGIIRFPSGSTTEKALFCVQSLFSEGWLYSHDPLKLGAIKFDGYRIPGPVLPGRDYTWYAVLIWEGRKPNPKFCATKEDLTSSKLALKEEIPYFSSGPISPKSPSKISDDEMIIGEVTEIRKTGAVVTMRSKGSNEKAIILGWRHENLRRKGYFLTTTQGVGLAVKDLVGYYVDPNRKMEPFTAVAHQIIVLKHAEEAARPNIMTHPLALDGGSPNTRNGILKQLASSIGRSGEQPSSVPPSNSSKILAATEMNSWKLLKQLDPNDYDETEDKLYKPGNGYMDSSRESSDYDSFDEAEDVSDEELNFLREGIMDLIVQENKAVNEWRITFLQKIMQETNNLINTRMLRKGILKDRPVTPSSSHDSGHATSAEVTPTGVSGRRKGSFLKMEKALQTLRDLEDDVAASSSRSKSLRKSAVASQPTSVSKKPPNWAEALSSFEEIRFCVHSKKWIPNPNLDSDDESDRTFTLKEASLETVHDSEDEIPEDELGYLLEDAKADPQGVPEEGGEAEKKKEEETTTKELSSSSGEDKKSEDSTDAPKDTLVAPKVKKGRRPKTVPLWIRYIGGALKPKKKDESKEDASDDAKKKDPATVVKEDESKEDSSKSKDVTPSEDSKKSKKEDSPTKEVADETDKALHDQQDDDDEAYDSDIDPEYVPPPILDSDCEYDEYSDGEISEDELKFLSEEKEAALSPEFVGSCNCAVPRKPRSKKKERKDITEEVIKGQEVVISEEAKPISSSLSPSKKEEEEGGIKEEKVETISETPAVTA